MLPQIWRGWREFRRPGRRALTSNLAEAGGFRTIHPSLDRPDIQLHFCIALVDNHVRNWHLARGYCVPVCVLRPEPGHRAADGGRHTRCPLMEILVRGTSLGAFCVSAP